MITSAASFTVPSRPNQPAAPSIGAIQDFVNQCEDDGDDYRNHLTPMKSADARNLRGDAKTAYNTLQQYQGDEIEAFTKTIEDQPTTWLVRTYWDGEGRSVYVFSEAGKLLTSGGWQVSDSFSWDSKPYMPQPPDPQED